MTLIEETWKRFGDRVLWYPKAGQYYFRAEGRWTEPVTEKNFREDLAYEGFFDRVIRSEDGDLEKKEKDALHKLECNNLITEFLIWVRRRNSISWVGELAGLRQGVHHQNGQTFLIPQGLKLPQAVQGDWSFIRGVIWELFPDEQRDYALAWMQHAYRAFKNHSYRFGQVLIIAGQIGDGKSLFQQQVLRCLFGGRMADAAHYLNGDTQFNKWLGASELWAVDDMIESKNFSRRRFMDGIKKLAADPNKVVEAKGKDAINVTLNQRCCVTINLEERNMAQLPTMTGDLKDKVIILMSSRVVSLQGYDENNAAILAQTPAFAHWLDNEYEAPEKVIGDRRFHVRAYQHGEIQEAVKRTGAAHHLREIIEREFAGHLAGPWIGYAPALWADLMGNSAARELLRQVPCQNPNRFSQVLSEVAREFPETVSQGGRDKHRGYLYAISPLSNPVSKPKKVTPVG